MQEVRRVQGEPRVEPAQEKESPVRRRKRELQLDFELEGTFPASDPPSSTQPVHPSSDQRPRDGDKD
jgi:hypothetical protein